MSEPDNPSIALSELAARGPAVPRALGAVAARSRTEWLLLLRLALRGIRRNWRHGAAASLSIVAGYVAMVCFQGYIADLGERFDHEFARRQMLGSVIIEKQSEGPAERRLSVQDQALIDEFLSKHASDVSQSVRFLRVAGTIRSNDASGVFVGVGHDVQRGRHMRGPALEWNAVAGDILRQEDSPQVLLGQGLGSALGCQAVGAGARPGLRCASSSVELAATTSAGRLNALDAETIGLVDASFKQIDARFVEMPLAFAQRLLDTSEVSSYSVELKDPGRATEFASLLRDSSLRAGKQLAAQPWREHAVGDMWRRTMSLLNLFRSFILSVVISIVALSVLNSVVKLVSERRRETATLRSLGFLRRQIVLLFLFETATMTALALGVGAIMAYALSSYVNSLHIPYNAGMLAQPIPLFIRLTPRILATSGSLLLLIAVLAAWLPARRAARTSPAKVFSEAS